MEKIPTVPFYKNADNGILENFRKSLEIIKNMNIYYKHDQNGLMPKLYEMNLNLMEMLPILINYDLFGLKEMSSIPEHFGFNRKPNDFKYKIVYINDNFKKEFSCRDETSVFRSLLVDAVTSEYEY